MPFIIFFPAASDIKSLDDKSHLSWDDPFYDIARHQIVEVAGETLLNAQASPASVFSSCKVLDLSLSFIGDDNFGRKVIVFNACRMPPQHQLDHHKLLM